MKIQGAIFDMDGTLIHSMEMWRSMRERYICKLGKEPEKGLDKKLSEMGWDKSYKYIRDTYQVAVGMSDEEIYEDIKKVVVADFYKNEVEPIKGMIDFLEKLTAAGVPICLATHTDLWLCEIVLERFGMRKYFKELFTAPELNTSKRLPDIYLMAQNCLGSDKEHTWVFEDASYAMRTVKEIGFPMVGIYDSVEPEPEAVKEMANIYIHDYTEEALDELFK